MIVKQYSNQNAAAAAHKTDKHLKGKNHTAITPVARI
jgi:hypothetical protein